MRGQAVVRRRPVQARRMRRFETEGPTVRAVVRQGANWAIVNVQRLPGLFLAIGCLALLAFLFTEPRFYVYGAEVAGNRLLAAEGIYRASATDMHSVFYVAPREVRQALLERFPGLQEVRVSVSLPARLCIQVAEKTVQFVWEAGGHAYLADGRGTVLGDGPAPADALHIRSASGPLSPGQGLDPAVLDTAARLSQLLGGVRTFEYTERYGVSWRTAQGWPAHFGVGGDIVGKVAVMRSMMAELAAKGASPQFLDVGVPSRPYYR